MSRFIVDNAANYRLDLADSSGLEEAVARKKPTLVTNEDGHCRLIVPTLNDVGPLRLLIFDNLPEEPNASGIN